MSHPLTAPENERALITAGLHIVADDRIFRDVPPEWFYTEAHRVAWSSMVELASEGTDPSPAAVVARLKERGAEAHTAMVWTMGVADPESPEYHKDVLKDRAARRRMMEAGRAVGERATDLTLPVADLIETAERLVFGLATNGTSLAAEPIKRRLMGVIGLIESGGYKGVPTGFVDLDAKLTGGGMLPGQLVCVAGATSMGKSAFVTGVAAHVAIEEKRPVLYCSIEMTAADNTLRLLCHEGRVDIKAASEGQLQDVDYQGLTQAAGVLNSAPLYLFDNATTVAQVRQSARRLKADEGGLGLIIVDHIQDMEGPGDNRREQIGGIARGLKALAKEMDCAIIAVSQLRRGAGDRDDRPRTSDLKESGDIENSSDCVWLLYRPEYYHGPEKDGKDLRGKAELIVAKQRNGQTGIVPLTWKPHCVRFENAARWPEKRLA